MNKIIHTGALDPLACYVRVRRPDGTEKILKMDGEQWTRVVDLANGEFGDKSVVMTGPELPREKEK